MPMRKTSARLACAGLTAALLTGFSLPEWTSARADLQVNTRKDVVELVDGTKIECTVLMEGPRGVLIAVKDPKDEKKEARQELIPLSKVKRIVRGKDEGAIEGFQTSEELARKVIQGSGFREKKEKPTEPMLPTGPLNPAQPLVHNPQAPASPTLQPTPNKKLTAKDVTEAYLTRFPALKDAAELFLGGGANAQAILQKAQEGDPVLGEQVRTFLGLFLQGATAAPPQPANKTPALPKAPVPPKAPAPKK